MICPSIKYLPHARFTCVVCGYVDAAKKANAQASDKEAAANKVAAAFVMKKINEIGTVVFITAVKSKIDAARTAYDALSPEQKKLVTNYAALKGAEDKFAALKAAAEKAAAEKAAAEKAAEEEAARKAAEEEAARKAAEEAAQPKITISKAPSILTVKPTSKKKVTVNLKKFKKNKKTKKIWRQIKKIIIEYSTDPTFPKDKTGRKIVSKNKTKIVITGLAKNTKYYVRARYWDGTGDGIKSGGVSAWSGTKKGKTKKR